jgi:hypothetical protein
MKFQNRTEIQKAKVTAVEDELKKFGLSTAGNALEKKKRLMEYTFPKRKLCKCAFCKSGIQIMKTTR